MAHRDGLLRAWIRSLRVPSGYAAKPLGTPITQARFAIAHLRPVFAVSPDWWSFAHLPNVRRFDSHNVVHRKRIIELAAEYRLPAIYYLRYFASDGGLIAYGPDEMDLFLRTASYVDRI
jgi:hypothetical protein